MDKLHHYTTAITWTGNNGSGTSGYTEYERSHTVRIAGKPDIAASSDAPFHGDITKHNPEDFLLASLSSCHMLWYLHLCADAGIIVVDYTDEATGTMVQLPKNGGHFTEVTLHPVVTITDASRMEQALALHDAAHAHCFIANSVNFPVHHSPKCLVHA
jgi:organic hydroperoxide reductase OsmC/OhrA